MPTIETPIESIRNSYDWAEVFADESSGNTTKDIDSPDGTNTSKFTREDIEEVIASVEGENDGNDWVGVFRLKDGRYLAAVGDCDYTGWD